MIKRSDIRTTSKPGRLLMAANDLDAMLDELDEIAGRAPRNAAYADARLIPDTGRRVPMRRAA